MPSEFEWFKPVIDSIEGWLLPGQDRFLFEKAMELPDHAIIVEVGAHRGKSTAALASACLGTHRRVYSIDTWTDTDQGDLFEEWKRNVRHAGVAEYVCPLRGKSADILSRWDEINPDTRIDLLFIDASHVYEDVRLDFTLGFPHVAEDGRILFHDVAPYGPGPQRVWHTLAKPQLINHTYEKSLACGTKSDQSISSVLRRRQSIKTLLWVRPDAIGDAVLSAGMLPALKKLVPHDQLIVICDQRVSEVYRHCPHVYSVIQFDRERIFRDENYFLDVKAQIVHIEADGCLQSVCTPEPLTHEFVRASAASFSVSFFQQDEIPGMDSEVINRMYSLSVDSFQSSTSELAHHKIFLQALGDAETSQVQPALWLGSEDRAFAEKLFTRHNIIDKGAIALFAGAQSDKRVYERYAEALALVPEIESLIIFALGAASDEVTNVKATKGLKNKIVRLNGSTTINQAAAILEKCRLAIGAETGLAHVACAVGTPNVIVLGGGHFGRFMPYSNLTSAVSLPLYCFNCNWQCKFSRAYCVKDITPELIAAAVTTQLNRGHGEKPRLFIPESREFGPGEPSYSRGHIESDGYDIIICKTTGPGARQKNFSDDQFRVSICIVTNAGFEKHHHREVYLRRLLSSIALAGFPLQTEILIAGAVPDELNIKVCAMPEAAEKGRIGEMRNVLAANARGKYIIQCDDDILFSEGYWKSIENALRDDVDVLCTRLLNPNGTRYWDWAAYDPARGQTLLPYDVESPHVYATGGHLIYCRSLLDEVKWDESLLHGENEEYSFASGAKGKGATFRFCPDATVFLQYHHCDAQAVVGQQIQYGQNDMCNEFREILSAIGAEHSISPKSSIKLSDQTSIKDDDLNVLLQRLGHKLVSSYHRNAQSPIQISVLTCCHRFLQRFRLFAQSLCKQNYDFSRVEVVVANPQSPDGLSAYLKLLKSMENAPEFVEVMLDDSHSRNRGMMIQKAFEQARGEVVVGMDCDLILPHDFLSRIIEIVRQNPMRVTGVYRNFLTQKTTAEILVGRLDPFHEFKNLTGEDQQEKDGYRGVLGYCQATTYSAWKQVGYPVEFDEIAKSDVAFNERLALIGVIPNFVRDITLLHLHHDRNWMGTSDFL